MTKRRECFWWRVSILPSFLARYNLVCLERDSNVNMKCVKHWYLNDFLLSISFTMSSSVWFKTNNLYVDEVVLV